MVVSRPAACHTVRRPLGAKGRLMSVACRILLFTISNQKFTDWPWINLIFIGPCIIIHSHCTTNKMRLLSQIIYSCKMLYMFWTVLMSIIRSSKLCIQQWYMSSSSCLTYTLAVYVVLSSWWWTERLSRTCRAFYRNK
jgi:hypothetical protein